MAKPSLARRALDDGCILSGMAALLQWPDQSRAREHMQPVLRSVTESSWVHFYLPCGHLITMPKADIGETMPREIDCWACAAEESGPELS
jgi:hypothetical protein